MMRPIKLEGSSLETLSSQVLNLRVRSEHTQLEGLSDASFLGKLLGLPANVRLDWKVIARYKHTSLLGLIISNKGNKFYNIDTKGQCYETFYHGNLPPFDGIAVILCYKTSLSIIITVNTIEWL